MADPNFSWIYIVIFLAIPLARIIPRILAKRGIGKNFTQPQNEPQSSFVENRFNMQERPEMAPSKPVSKNQLVLGALNRGSKTFENLQKNTGLTSEELDSVLGDLEKNGLLKVVHKQGLFGPKTELYPTEKGFKDYYS
jgi:predicted component of type VI protein secretion system